MGGRSGQSVNRYKAAIEKIDNLPKGKIFDDAKSIVSVFKKSEKSYSEVIESFEKNREKGQIETVKVDDIQVTQPNIQSNKVKYMLENMEKLPPINVVRFKDGSMAIFDGHHRLMANWALGNKNIKVNLVDVDN